jgi:hypothetical protein
MEKFSNNETHKRETRSSPITKSSSPSSPKNNTTRRKLPKKISPQRNSIEEDEPVVKKVVNVKKPNKKMKQTAISWLLHSIKILLGDESIRRYIILKYNPELKNNNHIKTFDAFVKPGKTREHKNKEIKKYLETISKLKKDIVVFTATNVQQNEEDNETHFQSFIVDNNTKKVYGIDPAYDKKEEDFIGIYYAEILHDVIKPFFEAKDYEFNLVRLSRPAQTTTEDVFCQSWSLMILLKLIENKDYENDVEFEIPSKKLDKYNMLLEFYKQIFTDMPELLGNLKAEYEGSINDCNNDVCPSEDEKPELLEFDASTLLMSMKKDDMK